MSVSSEMYGGQGLSATRFLSSCLQTALLLMSVFHTGISSVKADVRCYCNLPMCVTSGYMCKSSIGVCVSDVFEQSSDPWRSRHACLELAPKNGVGQVAPECPPPDKTDEVTGDNFSTRTCCMDDMCNYVRNVVDPQSPMYRLNHSYMTGYLSNDDYFFRHGGGNGGGGLTPQQHLWFKAAVIAVPIAGGFILILLIIMAARMLKADHKRQRQWSELRRRQRALDTRIDFSGGGDKPPGLLFFPKSVSSAILQNHPQIHRNYASAGSINHHQNNLYKNVSIAVSTDTSYTDTSRDKYFVFDL